MREITQETANELYDVCVIALNVFGHLYSKMGEQAYYEITDRLQSVCQKVRDDKRRLTEEIRNE